MGRAGWEIANSQLRIPEGSQIVARPCPSLGGCVACDARKRPLRTEESSPRSSAAEFRTSRFLKGCEKTFVHIADRQIWIDQACNAKWLYVRNKPRLFRASQATHPPTSEIAFHLLTIGYSLFAPTA